MKDNERLGLPNSKQSNLALDFGSYPMTPWERRVDRPKKQKEQHESIYTPKNRDDLFVLRQGDCSSKFVIDQDRKAFITLKNFGIERQELQDTVNLINKTLDPFKSKQSLFEKMIMFYLFIGLLLAVGLGFIFALFVHFAIAIVIGVLYGLGLVFLLVKTKLLNHELLLKTHFNLCLLLKNENQRLYQRRGVKLRPGYLSKWIEVHLS